MLLPSLLLLASSVMGARPPRPHIIFILADDLGWNDVGFHGSNQIPTPNIDAIAYAGIVLNGYYVTPICTPSRSALMTGKHPIHTGMQHTVLFGAEPRGLPLNEKLLPQYLAELGYRTRAVGKWHLGNYKKEYLPTFRGFESHFGYWTGHQDYNDHTAMEKAELGYRTRAVGKWHLGNYKKEYLPTFRGFESHFGYWTGHQDYNDHTAMEKGMWGLDMRRDLEPATELHGLYSTDLFTDEAVDIIQRHNSSEPLFLYLAHAAVHSGNPYNPLSAPDDLIASFTNISDYYRRRFAGMLTKLDISVGKVVEALEVAGMLQDSIVIFSSDNGGPAEGFNLNAASNWPLRGVKNTLWEGGVRGAGAVWSRHLKTPARVSWEMMHITDWLPTLITAAGGNASQIEGIDGIDMWSSLSLNTPSSRTEVLHNIDDIWGSSALTVGEWKLVNGTNYERTWDGWYGPSGREDNTSYDIWKVIHSPAGRSLGWYSKALNPQSISKLRKDAELRCYFDVPFKECDPIAAPCLFNITNDPCEFHNVADEKESVVKELYSRLLEYKSTAVPPGNMPLDPKGNPKLWNNMWTNFGDYETNVIY